MVAGPTARPPPPPCWLDFSSAGPTRRFWWEGSRKTLAAAFAWARGTQFILEGDEYDTAFFDKGPKFLHYFPDAVILTAVEFDHADIYHDLEQVKTAFKRLVNLVPRRGRLSPGTAAQSCRNSNACLAGVLSGGALWLACGLPWRCG